MHKKLSCLLFICFFPAIVSANTKPVPNIAGLFNAGQINLYLECFGAGSPTIVINSGFGAVGTDGQWDVVVQAINKTNRVCVYDRANTGKSDKSVGHYDVNVIAQQQHTLLQSAGVKPPYLLVGHSYGSYPIKLFNHHYADDVQAILVIDPSLYGMFKGNILKWDAANDNYDTATKQRMQSELAGWENPSLNGESINMQSSAEHIEKSSGFADKSFVLLWAKNAIWQPGEEVPEDWHPAVWQRTKQLYAADLEKMHALSTQQKTVFAQTPQHNIHVHEPDTVVNEIAYLLKKLQ